MVFMRSNKEKEVILIEMNQMKLLVKSVDELGEIEVTVVLDRTKNKYEIKFFYDEWKYSLGLHTQRKKTEPRYFSLGCAVDEIKKLGINQFKVILSE